MGLQTSPRPLDTNLLRIVRFAMLAGLLLFVGIAYSVHRQAPPDVPQTETDLATIRLVGFGLSVMMMVGILVLRGIRQRAAVERRGTLSLIGSAMGEAAALLGAVYFFLGGGLEVFAAGLIVFLATWTLLPADPQA
jgi:hypothetical protein